MSQSVEYYISKGFEPKAAAYFASGRKKIVSVKPEDEFTLLLGFDNGEKRIYDCKPLFTNGSVFNRLKNNDSFKRVYLDENSCVSWDIDTTVDSKTVWNNKIDLCPDSCYIDSIPAETII